MKRDFISILDWSCNEIAENLLLAQELKKLTKQGECPKLLKDKVYALIFHQNSLRTRLSFEVGIRQLGGTALYLTNQDFVIGEREPICDVAKVMSRYIDGILIRTLEHQMVLDLAKHADVPVVNMLTNLSHPCQIMADLLTVQERFGSFEDIKIVYLGDGNNVTNSWLSLAARLPINLCIATSSKTLPNMDLFAEAQKNKKANIELFHHAEEAVKGAHVLYTDVWASMGEKHMAEKRRNILRPYQITQKLLDLADPNAIVMHCLPAERGVEITTEVLEGPQSVILDQAENRLHAQKAILVQLERWCTA